MNLPQSRASHLRQPSPPPQERTIGRPPLPRTKHLETRALRQTPCSNQADMRHHQASRQYTDIIELHSATPPAKTPGGLVLLLRWQRTAVCTLTLAVMAWVLPKRIFRQNGSLEMLTFQGNLIWRSVCAYAPGHGGQFTLFGNQY